MPEASRVTANVALFEDPSKYEHNKMIKKVFICTALLCSISALSGCIITPADLNNPAPIGQGATPTNPTGNPTNTPPAAPGSAGIGSGAGVSENTQPYNHEVGGGATIGGGAQPVQNTIPPTPTDIPSTPAIGSGAY